MPNIQGQAGQAVATAPVMPRVNLIPPEIAEAARFRRFQLAMGGAVVAAIAIVGALYVHAHSTVSSAQTQLDAAKSENATLTSQLAGLQGVQDVYDQVAARKLMLQQAMGQEVRWSFYLTDLSLKIPDNVWLTSLAIRAAGATPGAGSAVAGVPGGPPPIANISYSGIAFSHNDVATWLDALAKEKGFVNPYFSSSSEAAIGQKKTVNFAGTVDVTSAALSNRYTKPAGS